MSLNESVHRWLGLLRSTPGVWERSTGIQPLSMDGRSWVVLQIVLLGTRFPKGGYWLALGTWLPSYASMVGKSGLGTETLRCCDKDGVRPIPAERQLCGMMTS